MVVFFMSRTPSNRATGTIQSAGEQPLLAGMTSRSTQERLAEGPSTHTHGSHRSQGFWLKERSFMGGMR